MVVGSLALNKEVVVIGGGPGGYISAIRAAQLGKEVMLVEKEKLGGVCLNKGCIPLNALYHLARTYKLVSNSKEIGINSEKIELDITAWQKYKLRKIKRLQKGIEGLLKSHEVDFVQGTAEFQSDQELRILTETGTFETVFENAVISVGARPVSIDELTVDNSTILTSYDVLELEKLPESLTVVGSRDFSISIAVLLSILGVKINLLYEGASPFSYLDSDADRILISSMKKYKIDLLPYTEIKKSSINKSGIKIEYLNSENAESVHSEKALMGLGFAPNLKELNTDAAGIKTDDRGFIQTDHEMRTSIPHIFAVGDITGGETYANRAGFEGKVAAETIAGRSSTTGQTVIPKVLYTIPETAWTGLQEYDFNKQDKKIISGKFSLASLGKHSVSQSEEGFAKLHFEEETGIIVGGIIVGENAGSLITQLTMAVEMAAHLDDFALTVPVHPTTPEAFMESADDVLGLSVHLGKKR